MNLKYEVCFGHPPTGSDDLMDAGLLELSAYGYVIPGVASAGGDPRGAVEFSFPQWDASYEVDADGHVRSPEGALVNLVEVKGAPPRRFSRDNQRALARMWYDIHAGIELSDEYLDRWIHDCEDIRMTSTQPGG